MDKSMRQVTLATLAGGAADELFIDALAKINANVQDLNTDHRVKRKIILEFTITADEERRMGDITVACKVVEAGVKGLKVGVYFGHQDGMPVAVEAPRQDDLFPTPKSLLREAGISQGTGVGSSL